MAREGMARQDARRNRMDVRFFRVSSVVNSMLQRAQRHACVTVLFPDVLLVDHSGWTFTRGGYQLRQLRYERQGKARLLSRLDVDSGFLFC